MANRNEASTERASGGDAQTVPLRKGSLAPAFSDDYSSSSSAPSDKTTDRSRPSIQILGGSAHTPLDKTCMDSDSPNKAQLEDIKDYLSQFEAIYNFTGQGSKNQIGNLDEMMASADAVRTALNAKHGEKKWIAVYGGDPYNSEKPDVGALMKYLHDTGVTVCGIQCSEYAATSGDYAMMDEKGGLNEKQREQNGHMDAIIVYKTEKTASGTIAFGGYKEGGMIPEPSNSTELVGTTWFVFNLLPELKTDIVKGHIAFGGGPIALMEMQIAYHRNLACLYVPTKAKHAVTATPQPSADMTVNKDFGPIHDYFLEKGINVLDDEFKKILQSGDNKDEQLKLKEPVFGWVTYKGEHETPNVNDCMHTATGYHYTFTKAPKNGFPEWEFYSE